MSKNNNSLEVVATTSLLQLFIRTQSVIHRPPLVGPAPPVVVRDEVDCDCSTDILQPRCNCNEVFHTHTAPSYPMLTSMWCGYHGDDSTLLTVMYRGGLRAVITRQMVSCKDNAVVVMVGVS